MSTKYILAERIQRMLDDNPTPSARPHINDIKLLVENVANSLLKTEVFRVNMPEGDTVPPNCMIATYENVPVQTDGNVCSLKLPAIPINLPRNMGVFQIFKEAGCSYIPIPSGMYDVIKGQSLLADQVGYEVYGSKVIFTQNLLPTVNSVTVRLVVVDFKSLSDYDLLPVSADMEQLIVESVYKMLVTLPPVDRTADSNDKI